MDDYWRILNEKLYSVGKEGRHKLAWNGPNEGQYRNELVILRPHFKPIVWGFGSAVSLFLSFRVSGNKRIASIVKSVFAYGSKSNGVGGSTRDDTVQKLRGGLSIPTDLFLSTLIGCSVTLFLTDFKQLKFDLEQLPLVAGKSFVSEELCSDFISLYQESNRNSTSEIIDQSLQHFILNCQKRIEVENHLKNQVVHTKSNDEKSISIPSPGVEYLLEQIVKEKGKHVK